MKNRRSFLQASAMVAAGMMLPSLSSCENKATTFKGSLSGPNASLGHRLRDGHFKAVPHITGNENVVIVGGGVAGLSAARILSEQGISFKLLELENEVGGNARSGENKYSKYPLGAHYLPIPSLHNTELIQFLQECNVITGFINDLPVYNDYHLCFDPKERLYINHHWQEGLVPFDGVPLQEQQEITRFQSQMDSCRHLAGEDGRMAFAIPVDESSRDQELLQLDDISMHDFLMKEKYTSPHLYWYVNYCCADDFGSSITDTSAWAGIHYFASRKGKAFNAKSDDVLTWPEGNDWLIQQLKKKSEGRIHSQCLVYSVRSEGKEMIIDYFDDKEKQPKRLIANQVIMATPQFINKHILHVPRTIDYSAFQYAPWMVANITLSSPLTSKRGEPLCWDNVIYGSDSLGYVNAMHQQTKAHLSDNVITYYKPLLGTSCAEQRSLAQKRDVDTWRKLITEDLKSAHATINESIEELNIWIWGHGMIRPHPGFIWGEARQAAQLPIDNKLFFAHTDLSGVSIFEEGFYSGLKAAQQLIHVHG